MAGGGAGDVGERELRRPLLPRQVPEAERAGEAGVAVRPVGEQQEVVAVGVGGVAVGHPPGVTWVSVSASSSDTRWSGDRPGVSVISVPNTVGIPTARAASAKRTTP